MSKEIILKKLDFIKNAALNSDTNDTKKEILLRRATFISTISHCLHERGFMTESMAKELARTHDFSGNEWASNEVLETLNLAITNNLVAIDGMLLAPPSPARIR